MTDVGKPLSKCACLAWDTFLGDILKSELPEWWTYEEHYVSPLSTRYRGDESPSWYEYGRTWWYADKCNVMRSSVVFLQSSERIRCAGKHHVMWWQPKMCYFADKSPVIGFTNGVGGCVIHTRHLSGMQLLRILVPGFIFVLHFTKMGFLLEPDAPCACMNFPGRFRLFLQHTNLK